MTPVHVVLAGGSCGNTLYLIEDQLKESFQKWDFDVHLTTQSIWQRFDLPAGVQLVLQTLPAYNPANLTCPVISVRPMIRDRKDPQTLETIKSKIQAISFAPVPSRSEALALGEHDG
jgi:hypothetical protein